MITSDNKPHKLVRWIQTIGSKLTFKQVVLRLVERKVIVIEKKRYEWVFPTRRCPRDRLQRNTCSSRIYVELSWQASQPPRPNDPAQSAQGLRLAAICVYPG